MSVLPLRALRIAGLAPVVVGQALHVRRTVLRLPEAEGRTGATLRALEDHQPS